MKNAHRINLGQWPPAMFITSNQEAYDRLMRQYRVPDPLPFPQKRHGLCQHLENGDGEAIIVIAIGKHPNIIELATTIAHEATHAMRWLFEYVGEKNPGTETEAYLIEHIVHEGLKALK